MLKIKLSSKQFVTCNVGRNKKSSLYCIYKTLTHSNERRSSIQTEMAAIQRVCRKSFTSTVSADAAGTEPRGGIHERNIESGFLGKDSSLLRLECLLGFLPSFFPSTKCYS